MPRFNQHYLEFTTASNLGTGPITFMGGDLVALASLNLPNNIVLAAVSGTIGAASGQTLTLDGTLTGQKGLFLNLGGTLAVHTSQPFAGKITLYTGTLTLNGNGSLPEVPTVVVTSGSTLTLDDSGTNLGNRFAPQTRFTVQGGAVNATGFGGAASAESFGELNVQSGSTTITLTPGAGGTVVVSASDYLYAGGSVLFRGTGLAESGPNTSRFMIAAQPDGFITGAIADTTTNGLGMSLAVYQNSVGVRTAIPSDYYSSTQSPGKLIQNSSPVATPTTANVRVDSAGWATGMSAESNTINSLTFAPGGTLAVSNTLTLTSGFVFVESGTASSVSGGNLAFGTTPATFFAVGNLTVGSNVTGSGGLIKNSAGTLTLNGNQSFTGSIAVTAGNLALNGSFSLTGGIGTDAGTVDFNPGVVLPTGNSLTITSGGVVNLHGNSLTFGAGAVGSMISAGTLNLGAGGAATFITLGIGVDGGKVNLANGTLRVTPGAAETWFGTLNDGMDGTGGKVVFDPTAVATLTLISTNTYSGGTTGTANARFILQSAAGFGTGPVNLSTAAGANSPTAPVLGFDFGIGNAGTVPNAITLPSAAAAFYLSALNSINQQITLGGNLTGGSAGSTFVWAESVATDSNVLKPTGTNTFQGTVQVSAGTVAVTADAVLGNSANTLDLATISASGGLRIDASGVVIARPVNLDSSVSTVTGVNTNGNNATISSGITGQGELDKTGAGTLTLSGTNVFTGAMKVAAGTLSVTGSLAAGVPVQVNAGGILGGTGTVKGAVTVIPAGVLAPGIGGAGTLTVGGNTLLSASAVLAVTVGASGANTALSINGSSTTLNVLTGVVLKVQPGTGFTTSGSALYTIIAFPSGSGGNLLLNGNATHNGDVLGTYIQGTGASGPVTIDASSFFTLSTGDEFLLSRSGDNLLLTYNAVPEPAGLLFAGAAFGALFLRSRRATREPSLASRAP